MVDVEDKLAYFQAITGLEDTDLCTEILAAHGWDLEIAVALFNGSGHPEPPDIPLSTGGDDAGGSGQSGSFPASPERVLTAAAGTPSPGLAWRLITLPVSVVSGGLGLISGTIGFGFWAAGHVISYSLGMIGFHGGASAESSSPPVSSVSASTTTEAANFISAFEREYGSTGPNFVSEGFMQALQRSRQAYKLMFVYLHSPDHPDTDRFCRSCLCSEFLSGFINANFVSWGGSIRQSEGFKMSNSLKASKFPFCAVVMPAAAAAAADRRIALLQQVEGWVSAEEMAGVLERAVEESGAALREGREGAEERRNNVRLREEQDAAYEAALLADREREARRREESERSERESAEARRKRESREELRRRKAASLTAEPEKGPNTTHVLIRFPNGEKRGRRFQSGEKVRSLYDYVDSLDIQDWNGDNNYTLVSNFPTTLYTPEKCSLSLLDAGLHPHASLFIHLDS